MFIGLNLMMYFIILYLSEKGWSLGHIPVIVKRAGIGSKSLTLNLSCKMFRDWSMINIREIIHFYLTAVYLLNVLKQHITALAD